MGRLLVSATWDDAPHLDETVKASLIQSYPLYQRDARTKGIPQLGAGAIFPFPESDIKISPFEIPRHWPRCFALDSDAGAGWTGIVWLAFDRETQTVYLYDNYKSRSREMAVHIAALKSRGATIPGVGDAAGLMVTQHDSEQVIQIYRKGGIDIELPDKSVEAGIQDVYDLMTGQRFRVFSTCQAWFDEWRLYRRNERGQIIKKNDHLMDPTRYGVRSGLKRAKVLSSEKKQSTLPAVARSPQASPYAWMG